VLVVEHDEDAIRHADHVIDMGPGAGVHGGEVVCQGTLDELLACETSITADYLSGRREIPLPQRRLKGTGKFVTVKGARANNLQNVTAKFPLGTFTCVTGVSGSGKSSLTIDTLYAGAARALNGARIVCGPCEGIDGLANLDKVIDIDQSPIGRTPRSNPAPTPAPSPRSATGSPACRRRRRAATSPAASASTSRAAGARRARATG